MSKKIASRVVHEVPNDMENALKADADNFERWNALTPIQRNEWICWVTIVKKPETRAEHIHRMMEELKEGKRQPCCWPGVSASQTFHTKVVQKNLMLKTTPEHNERIVCK